MNTDISQNNSQSLNTPEEKPVQKNSVESDGQTSEPQAEVSISQEGLRVEVTLSWKHFNQLLKGAKQLVPHLATIGLTTLGINSGLIQQFYAQPEAPAPIHQVDSQRPQ